MNKLTKTVLILIVIFFVSTFAGGLLFVSSDDFANYTTGNMESIEINDIKIHNLNGITLVNIDSVATDVELIKTNNSEASFELVGHYPERLYSKPPTLKFEEDKETIKVQIIYPMKKLTLGMASHQINLKIYLPKNYSEKLELTTVSGDVFAKDFELKNIKINTVSGDVFLEEIDSENLEIKTISGDVTLINSYVNLLQTTSGDIDLENILINNDLSIRTISGDIGIDYVDGSSFFIEYDSISGDLEKDFEHEVGEGDYKILVKTTSGDFDISKH